MGMRQRFDMLVRGLALFAGLSWHAGTLAVDYQVFAQMGHSNVVQALDTSAKSPFLITGSMDGSLVWWDKSEGLEYRRWQAPAGAVLQVLTVGEDQVIAAWSTFAQTGMTRLNARGEVLSEHQKAFSDPIRSLQQGESTVLALSATGELTAWSPELVRLQIQGIVPRGIEAMAVVDHSVWLVAAGRLTRFRLQRLGDGVELIPRQSVELPSEGKVCGLAVSVTGQGVLMRQNAQFQTLLDGFNSQGQIRWQTRLQDRRACQAAWSPNQQALAILTDFFPDQIAQLAGRQSASEIQVLDPRTGKTLADGGLGSDQAAIFGLTNSVRWLSNHQIGTAAWDNAPRVWNWHKGQRPLKLTQTLQGVGAAVGQMAMWGDRHMVTVAHRAELPVSDIRSAAEFENALGLPAGFDAHTAKTWFDRMGLKPVSSGKRRATTVWDLHTGQAVDVQTPFWAEPIALFKQAGGDLFAIGGLFPEWIAAGLIGTDVAQWSHWPSPPDGGSGALQAFELPAIQNQFRTQHGIYTGRVEGQGRALRKAAASAAGDQLVLLYELQTDNADPATPQTLELQWWRWVDSRWELNKAFKVDQVPKALALSSKGLWALVGDTALKYWNLHTQTVPASLELPSRALGLTALPDAVIVSMQTGWTKLEEPFLESPTLATQPWPMGMGQWLGAVVDPNQPSQFLVHSVQGVWQTELNTDKAGSWRSIAQLDGVVRKALLSSRQHFFATDDGSVHWMGARGERRLQSVHLKNGGWLSLTPDGYFAGSPGAEQAVNVRYGQRVYRMDQFFDAFYRPDLVAQALGGLTQQESAQFALQQALQKPAPKPLVQSQMDGPDLRLSIRLQDRGGGVGPLRVYRNGKLLFQSELPPLKTNPSSVPNISVKAGPGTRGFDLVDQEAIKGPPSASAPNTPSKPWLTVGVTARQINGVWSLKVPLLPGANELAVSVHNLEGSVGSPLTRWMVQGPTSQKVVPTLHLVTLGANQFAPSAQVPALRFAIQDVSALADRVQSLWTQRAPASTVRRWTLQDGQLTDANLKQLQDTLKQTVKSEDLVVWLVASHGVLQPEQGYGVVLHDWNRASVGVWSQRVILQNLIEMPAQRQWILLDTCHAGGLNTAASGLMDARLRVLARQSGLHITAGASSAELAIDGYQGHGLYTHHVLESLSELADLNKDGELTIQELSRRSHARTAQTAKRLMHTQVPISMHYGENVVLPLTPQ